MKKQRWKNKDKNQTTTKNKDKKILTNQTNKKAQNTSDGLMHIFLMVQVKCFWDSTHIWNKTLIWVSEEICMVACVL